jgi:hypothetical protein
MSQPALISWLLLVAHVLIVLVAAVLISANRKPSAAIAVDGWVQPTKRGAHIGVIQSALGSRTRS